MILALFACGPAAPTLLVDPPCRDAVVFDIDGTLTLSDDEYLMQYEDPTYDPIERPDAPALVQAYVDAGFTPIYISGRPEHLEMADDRTNRETTEQWFDAHGFVYDTDNVHLSDADNFIGGQRAINYKTARVRRAIEAGYTLSVGYAGGESDLIAFEAGEIGELYAVGGFENDFGAEPISDADAFTNHLASLDIVSACPR